MCCCARYYSERLHGSHSCYDWLSQAVESFCWRWRCLAGSYRSLDRRRIACPGDDLQSPRILSRVLLGLIDPLALWTTQEAGFYYSVAFCCNVERQTTHMHWRHQLLLNLLFREEALTLRLHYGMSPKSEAYEVAICPFYWVWLGSLH